MRTVFGLFQRFEDARDAAQDLLHRKFELERINVLLQDYVAKSHVSLNLRGSQVALTEIPDGLDKLVAGKQPIPLPDMGAVYAAGDIATELARTASLRGPAAGGLPATMRAFDLSPEQSRAYTEGIKGGGVLLWVRTDDERAGEAAEVLSAHHGRHVGGN